jgi:DNA-binding response OmpR family regulator
MHLQVAEHPAAIGSRVAPAGARSLPMTTILIIDDDEQLRRATTRVLAASGFECRSVRTMADALAAIAAHGPDVVLLDIALGTESGLDLHRAIRAAHGGLPAVIFTTSHRDVFGTMLEQLGPLDDWIIKPWDRAEFVARVALAARRIAAERGEPGGRA